ncbi:hypothetical protein DSCO28_66940 [Desulfosarcina ovata subsp. sediminis]|uniref:Uncharacterized protein n=1 Tax=Desulfosarcina ovata subsp. sediminis TaxID=885957 RepID=A0A5K8A192_9BACT|nr:hypothetical protein DSCO28_66940 [Desulfosarcina ovata subsp. sediminis]
MTNLQIQRNPFQIEQTQKLTREKQKTNQNVRQRGAITLLSQQLKLTILVSSSLAGRPDTVFY